MINELVIIEVIEQGLNNQGHGNSELIICVVVTILICVFCEWCSTKASIMG